jgi:hypothetical protein
MKYTCPIGRVYSDTHPKLTRVIIHVSKWTRVLHTRVHFGRLYNLTRVSHDTCQIGRVSTVTGTVDTRQTAKIFVVPSYNKYASSIHWNPKKYFDVIHFAQKEIKPKHSKTSLYILAKTLALQKHNLTNTKFV